MRMLVLGAGALGGYYGGRALEKGVDVTFLVRPRRAEQLSRDGLVVESAFGNIGRQVPAVQQAGPGFDVVLFTAKAYDLDSAIAAIRPAVEAGAAVLPVLNGMQHMDRLNAEFGPAKVWGGLAQISATLGPDGVIRQAGRWANLVWGEQDGRMDGKAAELAALLGSQPACNTSVVPDIAQRMWEKMVFIATLAGATVLFRAAIGDIQRAGGGPLMEALLVRNAAAAASRGHPPSEAALVAARTSIGDRDSVISASLLKDLEGGGPNEADQILGFMADLARDAGVPDELQRAAWVHAKAQGERRARGG